MIGGSLHYKIAVNFGVFLAFTSKNPRNVGVLLGNLAHKSFVQDLYSAVME